MEEDPSEQETTEQNIQRKIKTLRQIVESKLKTTKEQLTTESSEEEHYLSQLLTLLTLLQKQDFHPAMTICVKIDLNQLISFWGNKDIFSQLKEILEQRGIVIKIE